MSNHSTIIIGASAAGLEVGDVTKYGLRKLSYGPATQIRQDKRIPLIDVGTMKLIREGNITVYPGVAEVSGNRIRFEGGKEAEFDALILATGYRPRVNDFCRVRHRPLIQTAHPHPPGKNLRFLRCISVGITSPPLACCARSLSKQSKSARP